ncbi:MAG TPA: hypothetical protein VF876_14155 [Burkholderiales bacterium]
MRRPAPLQLDHFGNGRRAAAGWALLATALLAAAVLGLWQQSLLRQLGELESQARRAARPAAARASAVNVDPRRHDEAAKRAQGIAAELRLPWIELFSAVEAVADPAVALLAVEPDVRRAALRLSGEARNKQAMLRYVARLGEQRPIVRALLESHTERRGSGEAAVQFTLVAYWEQRP